jgi:two-component system sensor histidine kinase SenX3
LSIVKHVAADHGGDVTMWSEPGRGSTFTLRIPSADRPDAGNRGAPRKDAEQDAGQQDEQSRQGQHKATDDVAAKNEEVGA